MGDGIGRQYLGRWVMMEELFERYDSNRSGCIDREMKTPAAEPFFSSQGSKRGRPDYMKSHPQALLTFMTKLPDPYDALLLGLQYPYLLTPSRCHRGGAETQILCPWP